MATRTPAGDLVSRIAVQLLHLGGLLESAGDRMAAVARQTSARWRVMAAIEERPRTVASIARVLVLKRQSVQRVSDVLAEEGLAEYRPNPDDQRALLLALSPAGRRALAAIQAQQAHWANGVGGRMNERQLTSLRSALGALAESIQAQEDQQPGGARS